jgi:methylmalonyl-CoA mutase C-terminal domain/subunit
VFFVACVVKRMTGTKRPIRVLLSKIGLDGHDRGVKVVARILRDAGMEVVYTGLHRTVGEVVEAAVQEDVDVIGVSMLSGAHMTAFPKLLNALREGDASGIVVIGGGVVPNGDIPKLKALGVAEIFLQDTPPDVIVNRVTALVAQRRETKEAAR